MVPATRHPVTARVPVARCCPAERPRPSAGPGAGRYQEARAACGGKWKRQPPAHIRQRGRRCGVPRSVRLDDGRCAARRQPVGWFRSARDLMRAGLDASPAAQQQIFGWRCSWPIVAIGVHADEQCENRCGFVASLVVAVIRVRRKIKIVSAEYRDNKKQFHFRTNSQHSIFDTLLPRVSRSISAIHNPVTPRFAGRRGLTVPAARPIFINRRMASDRGGLSSCAAAHASISALSSTGMRNATIGSLPVAGRPRFRLGGAVSVNRLDCLGILSHTFYVDIFKSY
jgi:hypothetical protein